MPRIERGDRKKPGAPPPIIDTVPSLDSQKTEPAEKGFLTQFLATRKEQGRERLDKILKDIDAQAEIIATKLTFGTLARYKDLVRKFLTAAMKDIYNVSQKEVVDRTGRKKALIIVEKVNKALEQLTTETIQSQGKIIDFMARLDEIRGLLVDLYS